MPSESSQARTAAGMELVITPPQSVIKPRKTRATLGACGWAWPAVPRGSSIPERKGPLSRSATHQVRVRSLVREGAPIALPPPARAGRVTGAVNLTMPLATWWPVRRPGHAAGKGPLDAQRLATRRRLAARAPRCIT